MKRFILGITVLFTLAVALLGHNNMQTNPIESIGTIQSVKNESVVLVSSNVLNGEISSYQGKNDQSFSGSDPFAINSQTINSFSNINSTQIDECTIHNISTSNKKTHNIRAP